MRAFIVLCLVAAASADVSSLTGYNYQAAGSDGSIGGSAILSGSSGDNSGAASNVAPSVAGGDGGYEKEFYSFSANDGDFEQPDASEQIANSLKQNLRVIFVKGPENSGLENAALNLAKQASEQRTAIYVLNKQADIGDLANKLNAEQNNNRNRPEVHFVKYRTPEDAQNAQSQIQNQYAALGGPSQSHDGGVAPVLDFASKGPSYGGRGGNGAGAEYGSYSHSYPSSSYVPPASSYVPPAAAPSHSYIPPAAPSNSYIPPSIFRSIRI